MKIFNTPWHISGIAGILFVSLSFIAVAINTTTPSYNDANATLQLWFPENGQGYRFGHFMAGIAFLLFYFPFYAGLCERLNVAEGKPAIWTRVTWAGAIMSPATGTIAGSFIMALAFIESNATVEIAKFGLAANFYAYVVSGAFGGIVMVGSSIIILRTDVFKRWLGWIGIIVGVAAIISTAALTGNEPQGLFVTLNSIAWLIYFLWIGAVSIELLKIKA